MTFLTEFFEEFRNVCISHRFIIIDFLMHLKNGTLNVYYRCKLWIKLNEKNLSWNSISSFQLSLYQYQHLFWSVFESLCLCSPLWMNIQTLSAGSVCYSVSESTCSEG